MDGFYDWLLEYIGHGENWDGALPLYFGEEAFTILLIQYAFIVYKTIKYKGNLNRALFGHMPFLSKDKLSMIPDNDKVLIYFARYFGSIFLVFFNYYALYPLADTAVDWSMPAFNIGLWLLCYMAQEASYK